MKELALFVISLPMAGFVYLIARGSVDANDEHPPLAKLRGLVWVAIAYALMIGLGQLPGSIDFDSAYDRDYRADHIH